MLHTERTTRVEEEAGTTEEAAPTAQAGHCCGLRQGGRGGRSRQALMTGWQEPPGDPGRCECLGREGEYEDFSIAEVEVPIKY